MDKATQRPEARRVAVVIESIVSLYQAADQKLALVDTLLKSDAAAKLNRSDAAHGFNRLVYSLYLDVLGDLWAITLDTNSDAPSIFRLNKLIASAGTRAALREHYTTPLETRFVGEDEAAPTEAMRQAMHDHHRRQYGEQFDLTFEIVVVEIENLLRDERLKKLQQVRHSVISHYSIEEGKGKPPALVPIDKFEVHWHDAEEIFEILDPLLAKAVLIFTGKNYGERVRFDHQHREWSRTFWNAVRQLGPEQVRKAKP